MDDQVGTPARRICNEAGTLRGPRSLSWSSLPIIRSDNCIKKKTKERLEGRRTERKETGPIKVKEAILNLHASQDRVSTVSFPST